MSPDIIDLRSFYATPLGEIAQYYTMNAIRRRWPRLSGLALMGLGYTPPYLEEFRSEAERVFAFMPAQQGAAPWPDYGNIASALVDPLQLPLQDSCLDRILLVHALEASEDPTELMSELWRVLSPGGYIMLVVPNRRSAWAGMDSTPFGYGQPYSRGQVTRLLRDAHFTPLNFDEALYMPPVPRKITMKFAPMLEKLGAGLSLPFAGVHLIEATKQIWRPAMVQKSKRFGERFLPRPALAPTNREKGSH